MKTQPGGRLRQDSASVPGPIIIASRNVTGEARWRQPLKAR
jgi:hypothetical protein